MKRIAAVILLITIICVITACDHSSQSGQETHSPQLSLGDVEEVICDYNETATAYNQKAKTYNEIVIQINNENQKLNSAITAAQLVADAGETPFDAETLTALEQMIAVAEQTLVVVGEALPTYDLITLPDDLQKNGYAAFCDTVQEQIATIEKQQVPEVIAIPDYSDVIKELETVSKTYLSSVQSMKQVTAPEEDFVVERLKRIDYIVGLAAVTEEHDPNKLLGTEGGYISCLYFSDSRVDKTQLNIPAGKNNVIDIGTVGGGSIEVYSTVEDAVTRNEYLTSFDGTDLDPGTHMVVGTLIIRISSKLSGAQQDEMTEQITSVLTSIE